MIDEIEPESNYSKIDDSFFICGAFGTLSEEQDNAIEHELDVISNALGYKVVLSDGPFESKKYHKEVFELFARRLEEDISFLWNMKNHNMPA